MGIGFYREIRPENEDFEIIDVRCWRDFLWKPQTKLCVVWPQTREFLAGQERCGERSFSICPVVQEQALSLKMQNFVYFNAMKTNFFEL